MTVPVCVHSYVHTKFDDRKIKIKCEDIIWCMTLNLSLN